MTTCLFGLLLSLLLRRNNSTFLTFSFSKEKYFHVTYQSEVVGCKAAGCHFEPFITWHSVWEGWITELSFLLLAYDDSLELFYRLCLAPSMALGEINLCTFPLNK